MKSIYAIDAAIIAKSLNLTNPPGNLRGSDLVDTIVSLRTEGWELLLSDDNSLEDNTAVVYWGKKQLIISVSSYEAANYFFQLFLMKKNMITRADNVTEIFEIVVSTNDPAYVYDIQSKCFPLLPVKPTGIVGLVYLTKEAIKDKTGLDLRGIDIVKYNCFLLSMNVDEMEFLIDILSGQHSVKDITPTRYNLSKQTTLHKFKIWGLLENTYDSTGRFWRGTELAANLHKIYNTIK